MTNRRQRPTPKPPPVPDRSTLTALEQLPNVGPAVAGHLRKIGVNQPGDLAGRDPYAAFDKLCRVTGQRLDPCLLDTIIAAVRFMDGEEAKPWWAYTAERKRELARRDADQEGPPMNAEDAEARLRALADEGTAAAIRRFFKTGPGQYGEGDRFLGVKADPLKRLARECRGLSLDESVKLLGSGFHEARMLALLVLVAAFEEGDETTRGAVYELYLANTGRVNNWDLVDASAPAIVGGFLANRGREPLTRLARSASLWERRIAVVATLFFIRRNDFADTLRLAGLLLGDREDLIHKAAGWMLREVGKRERAVLEGFLAGHCRRMPRTMLRYAIERLPEERRRMYLKGGVPTGTAREQAG